MAYFNNILMKKIHLIIFITLITGGINAQTSIKPKQIDPEKYKIISTDRPDGRYVSSRGLVQHMMRNIKPQLAFNPQFSKEEFEIWQNQLRIKMHELMQFPEVPPQPMPKLIKKEKRDGYSLEKWEIYPQPGSVVPFLLLIPDGVNHRNPAPAVLCFSGSSGDKETLAGEKSPVFTPPHPEKNQMALFYVKEGLVAIAVDHPGVGESSDLELFRGSSGYDRDTFSRYLLDMGWSYLGLCAFQGQQILTWMKNQNYIDKNRIALSGHSLGTEPLMVLSILNPDIHAIVFNDFLCRIIKRAIVSTKPTVDGIRPRANWLGHCVPGLWKWFDYPDIIACIAPRPIILTEGGAVEDLDLIKHAYKIMDAEDNLAIYHYPKYQDPQNRLHDYEFIPEGLDDDEYFKYVNVDVPNHYFKSEVAVPWLVNVLKK
jgi:hypothetical protein